MTGPRVVSPTRRRHNQAGIGTERELWVIGAVQLRLENMREKVKRRINWELKKKTRFPEEISIKIVAATLSSCAHEFRLTTGRGTKMPSLTKAGPRFSRTNWATRRWRHFKSSDLYSGSGDKSMYSSADGEQKNKKRESVVE